MKRGQTANIAVIALVVLLAIAGLWWVNSNDEVDECRRWQVLVREQANLLAPAGHPPSGYYEAAAQTYAESRPEGCDLPS